MYRVCLSLIITIFFFTGCGGDGKNSSGYSSNDTTIPTTGIYDSNEPEETKFIKTINYARSIGRSCGSNRNFEPAPPLSYDSSLYAAALEHSIDMAKSNTFSHTGSGTSSDVTGSNIGHPSSFNERIASNGYNNSTIGENIAAGYSNIEKVVSAWLKSPNHCEELMNKNYTKIGIAKYKQANTKYTNYWTADFGG